MDGDRHSTPVSDRLSATKLACSRSEAEQQHRLRFALEEALFAEHPPAVEIGVANPPVPVKGGRATQTQPRAHWPATSVPRRPLRPPPGFLCTTLEGSRAPIVGVSVFRLAGADLEARVRQISLQQRADMNFIPVFLTDSPRHEVFVRYGYAFEYFPRWRYASRTDDAMATRLQIVARKWNFRSVSYLDTTDESDPPSNQKAAAPSVDVGAAPPTTRSADVTEARREPGTPEAAVPSGESARLIRESGLFDEAWYLAQNPDVAASGEDPIVHYLRRGAQESRDPSPLFDTAYYARQMDRYGRPDGG